MAKEVVERPYKPGPSPAKPATRAEWLKKQAA